ncbi:hypothetical protein ACU4GD_29755 [Cupriavidus basilensis]
MVFRPILNASLARVTADASVAQFLLESEDWQGHQLHRKWPPQRLWVRRLGDARLGAPCADLRRADIEVRYTNIHLQSFGGTSSAVTGTGAAQKPPACMRVGAPHWHVGSGSAGTLCARVIALALPGARCRHAGV